MRRVSLDLGAPVAHLALAEGVPVYDHAGRRVGVVDRVIDAPGGIFEGIVIHTLPLPGRHLYAGHEQIAELRERGVILSVNAEELQKPRQGRRRQDADGAAPENPLQARLRRAWDWLTGVR